MIDGPPPVNNQQSDAGHPAKKSWMDLTLGEIAQKASRVGLALVAGYNAAKDVITDKKEDSK